MRWSRWRGIEAPGVVVTLLIAACLFLSHVVVLKAASAWSVITSCNVRDDGDDDNHSCTLGASLAVGDLVFVTAGNLGADDDVDDITLNSGAEDLGTLTGSTFGIQEAWHAHTLATTQSGSTTVNVHWAGTVTNPKCIMAYAVRAPDTKSVDHLNGWNGGTSSAPASDTINTTGDDVVFGYAYSSQTISSPEVNNIAADSSISPSAGCELWRSFVETGFTGNADATLSSGTGWLAGVTAFKNTAAGGASTDCQRFGLIKVWGRCG